MGYSVGNVVGAGVGGLQQSLDATLASVSFVLPSPGKNGNVIRKNEKHQTKKKETPNL